MIRTGADRNRSLRAIVALRATISVFMIIHGIARISLGIVDDFGGFFAAKGLPFGVALAWAVTLFELVGGTLLASGRWVRLIAIGFMVQLTGGAIMVHMPDGWFVVGAGRNGMEYATLLVILFGLVAYSAEGRSDGE